MNKNIYYTIIIGANSFIGKNIIKKLPKKKIITFTRKKYYNLPNNYIFKIGDDINKILPRRVKVSNIIYLAWERRKKLINGFDSNIHSLKNVKAYAIKKNCKILFASSFSAIDQINYYGTQKAKCEKLLKGIKNFKIFRIAMVTSRSAGLITIINNFFKKLPFVIVPGDGNFIIYFVSISKVVTAFIKKDISKYKDITYLYDGKAKKYINCINKKNKLLIKVPIIIIKLILFLPHKLNILNTSFNYDGFLGLIYGPKEINYK